MIRGIIAIGLVIALGGGALFMRDARAERDPEAPRTHVAAEAGGRANVAIDGNEQARVGVRVVRIERGTLARPIRLAGTIRYDETRLTDINLKLDGWIDQLNVTHVGQSVSRGESLFSLYSPELLVAQNDLISALKSRDLLPTASPGADAQDYRERLVGTPRQRLVQWGVPEDQLRAIEQERQVRSTVVFRAPVSGVVIEKTVVNGMFVQRGATLYRLADLSVVWLEVDVPESEVAFVQVGAPADATARAWPGARFSGRVINVDPFVTESTRTMKARIAVANAAGRLRPGMFASVDLSADASEGLLVPADAVVDSGTRQVVFVREGDSRFEPRHVRVGQRGEDQVVILEGLAEGDAVVAQATFFVDAESQMRAEVGASEAPAGAPQAAAGDEVTLTVALPADLSRTADNVVDVRLRDGAGKPVSDADVRMVFSMPPMPSMNMPAMRTEARLHHLKDGLYRGKVAILMSGRWDMTATARRRGRQLAERRASVMVRE